MNQIDGEHRTRNVSGSLRIAAPIRSRIEQRRAGGRDRLREDDGGHYIAPRFNGPTEAFNHFAQDANVNRGRYRVLEDQWAAEVRRGKRVFVDITPIYRESSKRPAAIKINYSVDGTKVGKFLPNEKGPPRAK